MLVHFLTISIFILLVRGTLTLIFLLQSFNWLEKNIGFNKEKTSLKIKPKLTVLIPALREQKRIISTLKHFVKYFLKQGVRIIVITTQKEFESRFEGPSTRKIVIDFIKKQNLENKICCINYPKKNGIMAHQLNFVLKTITNKNSFIAIYNADSKPHPKTVQLFYEQLLKHPDAQIFQQSSVFIKNYSKFNSSNSVINLFLRTSAILQTRWTFAHEFPRLMRQSVYKNNFFKRFANAHVVGHGLFIKTAVLKEVGGFPTQNLTEDLFLGYLLRSKGYYIYPLPLLELADSPSSVQALWRQKYVWFWGPMKYITYLKYVVDNSKALKIKYAIPPIFFTIQGLLSAIAWLSSAPIVIISLLSPLFISNITFVFVAYIAIFIYGPLQFFIVYYNFPILFKLCGEYHPRPNLQKLILVSLMSVPAIIFNSIPPYFSLFSEINHKLTGKSIYKPKTE